MRRRGSTQRFVSRSGGTQEMLDDQPILYETHGLAKKNTPNAESTTAISSFTHRALWVSAD